jgi:hypothetical protein
VTAQELLASRLGGRYVIERELGRGGMGAVYLARDVKLDRPVALKVLPAEFATQSGLRDRFLRETRTAASFSHPNIVPVYAVEESEDLLAYAMAYVEGESLAERVKRAGVLSVRETVRLLQDVGYALAYAHGRGVVHRDIKPDNVMIERATGRALVMDFGIARVIAAPAPGTEGLTRVGEVVGTPEYMSPEQATGDHVDGRSDLYSLGLTAFYGVTGTPAISGDTTGKVLARQITEPLPSVRAARSDLPAPLAEAIERCAAKDPADRYQNAEALVEALDVAKLAAPEIPLAIRVFAQEASTLGMVLIFGGLFIAVMIRILAASEGSDDLILPIALLLSVLVTRVLQTRREAGRLVASGFASDEINRGMQAVIAERETRRAELRADAATRRARRITLIMAVAQLAGAVVMFWAALRFRHQVGPQAYRVETPGMVLILTSMMMLGTSLALLLRSPFRAPIGERLFRMAWLGPIGRGFIRFSGGKRAEPSRAAGGPGPRPGASVSGSTAAAPRSVVSAQVSAPPGALAELESRVSALEKWRRESQRS